MKWMLPILAIAGLLSGCNPTRNVYLPPVASVNRTSNGSFILVKAQDLKVKGELIAIQDDKLFILTSTNMQKSIVTVSVSAVKKYRIHYARSRGYGWTIPIFTAFTLTHGILMLITGPLNLVTTTIVTVSSNRAYSYDNKDITYDKLKMFARFPQGVPAGVKVEEIR